MKKKLFVLLTAFIFAFSINLAAESNPKITGPDLIQKEKYQVLTLSDILALYSSNVGGVSILSDDFTGNGATIGTYQIELVEIGRAHV